MFIEIPIRNKLSIRSMVCGVGINDASYVVKPTINGKSFICPFYACWVRMLNRCYSPSYNHKHPTYIDCTVTIEWLRFSTFKLWMTKQDWKGKQLDKDILVQGNKIYSPLRCTFIIQEINKLLNKRGSARGKHPRGVYFNKQHNKFHSIVRINGKTKHIGFFNTPEEAFDAYKERKYIVIKEVALQQVEPLKSALLNYKITN